MKFSLLAVALLLSGCLSTVSEAPTAPNRIISNHEKAMFLLQVQQQSIDVRTLR